MSGTYDRRDFLKLGAASAGAALGCGRGGDVVAADGAPGEMRYRALGGTGLEVSEISFGAHGVDNPPLMAAAIEAGINTFCTSGQYMDGREEAALGETLARIGRPRDSIVIVTGNETEATESVERLLSTFDASLRRLRTDYVDVYYNAMVQTPRDVHLDNLFEAFERARQAGKVRHLAISGHHGGMQDCLRAGIDAGRYDVFFTKYDFVSYPDQDEILHRAAELGIGTMVFKVGAGNRQHEIEDLEAGGLSFQQATLKWALGNPDIASVAVTFKTFEQIRTSVAAVSAPLAAEEVAMLRRYADEMRHRYCRFCATCEASCERGVKIADVMRYEMYFSCYGREKEAMSLYKALPAAARASACRQCSGHCDGRCPFGRPVREGLIAAHERLDFRRT
jgi:aryl-alcohol dehydrogenase-like predicted oxidoreductase